MPPGTGTLSAAGSNGGDSTRHSSTPERLRDGNAASLVPFRRTHAASDGVMGPPWEVVPVSTK
jgi:hypothetical protein